MMCFAKISGCLKLCHCCGLKAIMHHFLFGQNTMKKLFVLSAVFLLSACGFHLKGVHNQATLPVQTWYVQGDALQQYLENALRYADGKPIDDAQQYAHLRVLRVEEKKDIYTITRAARLNENLLSLRVLAQAYYQNRAWGEPISVEVRRVLPYSDSMVLGKQEEEQILWREMRQDAAQQVVRQLGFIGQP